MYRDVPFRMQPMELIYAATRVSDFKNKTVEQLRKLKILDALQEAIDHADIDAMTRRRQQKRGAMNTIIPAHCR